MLGAGRSRDAFVDQGAAQIVDAGGKQQLGHARSLFHPGGLYIGYPIVEHDPRNRMHLDHFHAGRAGAHVLHQALHEHWSFGMHETEGHELGDAAGLLLDTPDEV